MLKKIIWLGSVYEVIKGFPKEVRQDIGYNLDILQRGFVSHDWKPMIAVGQGVNEIRIHHHNEYRVFYVAKFSEAIYVLHAFEKKSQQTLSREIKLGHHRYLMMLELRRNLK